MVHPDILVRLPDAARQKLLLLDGLSDEALDLAQSAQGRLNDLAARRGYPEDNPTVARLGAVIATQDRRRQELFNLVNAVQTWVRALPPAEIAPLEIVAAPAPPSLLADGDQSLTPEAAVMRIRSQLGDLTVERMAAASAPRPKDEIRAQAHAQMAKLAAAARPVLRLERGRAEVVFGDPRGGFEVGAAWVAGLIALVYPGAMADEVDRLIDAAVPDDAATMTEFEQQAELARLDTEIDALQRVEEALIEAAFSQNVDILRRPNASPDAVLGVRLVKPAVAPRRERRPRLPGPLLAGAKAAE